MNEKIPDELLSASFDGELSPEDQGRVDAHLANDAQARRTREDFKKLSGLLQELPAPTAPAEFRAAVMQDIERQMLLGPANVPAKPTRSGASAARRFRWAAGAVSLAAAAVLMVAFAVARRDFGVPQNGVAEADFDGGVAVAHRDEDNAPMSRESSVRAPAIKAVPESAVVRNEATTDARKSGEQNSAPSSAPAAPLSSSSMAGVAKPVQSGKTTVVSGRSQFEFRSNPSEAELGQVVEAWERSQGKVAVVRLTVVDRKQSVQGLQTLLTRNSISEEILAEAKEAAKPAEAGDISGERAPSPAADFSDAGQPDGELIGVLVEAPSDQLAQVLRQIQIDEQQEMSIDESIEVAELPAEFAQSRLGAVEGDFSSDEKDKKIDSSGSKENSSRPGGSAGAAPMKRESSKKDAVVGNRNRSLNKLDRSDAEKPTDAPEAPRMATQRQVNVPSRILNRMPAKDDAKSSEQSPQQKSDHLSDSTIAEGLRRNAIVAARPAPSSGEGLQAKQQGAQEKAGLKQGHAPVQVLFVFVNKPGQAVPSKAAAPIKAKVRREGTSPTKNDGAAS